MSSVNTLPLFQQGIGGLNFISTASSVGIGGTAFGSQANPYVLNGNFVNFNYGSQPQYMSYNGSMYQFATGNNQGLQYTAPNGQVLNLAYNGQTRQNDQIVGYDRYREQVGTEQYQVGTEQYITGYEQVQTGTKQVPYGTEQYITGYEQVQTGTKQVPYGTEQYIDGYENVLTGYKQVQTGTEQYITGYDNVITGYKQVQTGTEQYITGYEQVQTGTKQVQVGTEPYITGYEQVQTGTKQVQVGTEPYITGYEQVLTGYKQVQTGTEKYIDGYEQVLTGYKQVQTGTEQYITGYEQVQTGTKQVQVGTGIVGYNTRVETGTINVSRELDGRANGGAVGDILDQGTGLLMDASKANQFFTTNSGQYKVGSLLGENNATNGESVDIFKKLNADDMYVAGDPVVGGKGNGYNPDTITPGTGFITMYEDGTDAGRKVTINAHVDTINPQGNKAFTEYGFVIQGDNGQKTTATVSGGQAIINGQPLLPGQERIIGDPANPVAKFYYASVPGGQNGTNEQRLVFESYEKVTPETRQKLIDAGANPADIDGLRSTFKATFGFRIPDGQGSYRASAGVPGGMSTTYNGVKTYYDAHFYEPDSFTLPTRKEYQEPVYGPIYEEQPVYEQRPVYGERPVYEQQPVYENRPIYKERPVYEQQPVYEQRPVYGERPIYEDQPIYEQRPVYGERPVYEQQPIYDQVPVYGERPVYEQQPIYEERPIYGERTLYRDEPIYEERPIYGERTLYRDEPIYEERPTYGERTLYRDEPIYEERPIYGERPVYKERPVYRDVEKPIYGTDYGVTITYGNTSNNDTDVTPPVYPPPPVYCPPTYTPPVTNNDAGVVPPVSYNVPPTYTPPVAYTGTAGSQGVAGNQGIAGTQQGVAGQPLFGQNLNLGVGQGVALNQQQPLPSQAAPQDVATLMPQLMTQIVSLLQLMIQLLGRMSR